MDVGAFWWLIYNYTFFIFLGGGSILFLAAQCPGPTLVVYIG